MEQKEIKQTLKELMSDSSVHGLPRIVRSKSCVAKLIWTLFLLGFTSYCALMVQKSILSYLHYDTVMRINNFVKIPADFPVINWHRHLNFSNKIHIIELFMIYR